VKPMDNFEKQLKQDALDIRVDVSPQMAARIEASIHATERASAAGERRNGGASRWWFSTLAGVVGALLIIVLINRDDPTVDGLAEPQPTARVVPEVTLQLQDPFPLEAKTAVLAEPLTQDLEQELENLKSDLEKARQTVEEDLRQSF